MTMISRLQTRTLLIAFAGVAGIAVGCSFGGELTDEKECGAIGSHSELDETTDPAMCVCDAGYDWCNMDDDDDFRCCAPDDECLDNSHEEPDGCVCDEGYEWCDPNNENDLRCCPIDGDTGTGDGGTGTGDGTGDGGDGGDECDPGQPPDAGPCDVDALWCTSTDPDCPGDFYRCEDGEWVLDTEMGDADCMFNGDDFSYGCYDDPAEDAIIFVCGTGPGTDCNNDDEDTCSDSDTLSFCKHGKLSEDSCNRICTEEGDAGGALYDFGECGEQDGSIECLCCDFDDPDCGDGGSTGTDTGGTGATGTSGS